MGLSNSPFRGQSYSTSSPALSSATLSAAFSQTPAYTRLTPSQKRFATLFFEGVNLFLTGEAGTGKSYLMRALYDFAETRGVALARTASTGVAALNIGGQTINSWAGMGLADEDITSILTWVNKNRKAQERIRATRILVIDEISMVKADLLDKLDLVCKSICGVKTPFGGLQIVVVGDFLQLPPVFKGDERKDFAFNSRSWREAGIKKVALLEQVRQDGSLLFAGLLGRIRVGDVSDLDLLSTRIGAAFPASETEPVRLFCKNVDVNVYNAGRLAKLPGDLKRFHAKDDGQEHHITYFDKHCPAPTTLELKIGVQVMLLVNLDVLSGLVNGSVGVVRAFGPDGITVAFDRGGECIVEENQWEIKEQVTGLGGMTRYKVVATRLQYPLKLAYATSVHKSQGSTLDRVVVDLREAFAEGQIYTALSRVRSLEGLSIVGEIPTNIHVNLECKRFYEISV